MMNTFVTPSYFFIVFQWIDQLFHPIKFTSRCLKEGFQHKPLVFLSRFWYFPILLSLAADSVALHIFQIEFTQYYFIVPYFMSAVFSVFAQAVIFFICLRLLGLRSDLGVVFVVFTVFVAYSPIYSWMGLPSTYSHFLLASKIKTTHPDVLHWDWKELGDYIVAHAKDLTDNRPDPFFISAWGGGLKVLFSFCLTALVGDMFAQIYRFNRFKTLLAASIANIFSVFPEALGGLLQLLLFYVYVP